MWWSAAIEVIRSNEAGGNGAVREIAEHVSDAAGAVEGSSQLDPDLIGFDADRERHQLPKSAGQHSFPASDI
jgi:hypothetical protein